MRVLKRLLVALKAPRVTPLLWMSIATCIHIGTIHSLLLLRCYGLYLKVMPRLKESKPDPYPAAHINIHADGIYNQNIRLHIVLGKLWRYQFFRLWS